MSLAELKPYYRYKVKGQEMFFFYLVGDTAVFYYYVEKEIFYYYDHDFRRGDIEKFEGPMIFDNGIYPRSKCG